MPSALEEAVLAMVVRAGDSGLTMGKIVDRLNADGVGIHEIEHAIWKMIQARHLTPHGFVCRTLRTRGATQSVYEFLLIAWSPDQDQQLDLGIDDE